MVLPVNDAETLGTPCRPRALLDSDILVFAKSLVMDGPGLVLLPRNRRSSRAVRRTMSALLPDKPSKLACLQLGNVEKRLRRSLTARSESDVPFAALPMWDAKRTGFSRARQDSMALHLS